MRKEVFYSLMAMTAVPGAANATPVSGTGTAGAIIPDVISFDNNAADQDGDAENGLIKWCSGDITFNINKKLVPGTYTFRARLLTSAAAVWVKIPQAIDPTTNKAVDAKQNMVTDLDPDNSDRDIEVKFVITEETSDLAITIHPATNYDVADNKYYLIGKCKDTNLESGLIFDESNFTTALESLNKLIDDYVNKVFNVYESQVARQLMNSAKEEVQGMITNVSNLTYDDYVDNGLGEEDLKQSPIYKKATKLFNQSTRIEADYQTKKLKEQIEKALEDSKEDILDADSKPTGEKTPANPYLEEMADKALKDIETYDKRADEKTGATIDAQGNVQGGNEDAAAELDPKILEEGGFDVDPNFPPLKNLVQETDRVSKPGGFAHVIADALQLSDKAIKEREDDLTEKFNEMGDLLGDRTISDKFLNGAKSITDYYRGVFEQIKAEVYDDEMSIPEMTSDFKDDIKNRLEKAINNNVKETSDYIKAYYTLYNNYKSLLATLKLDEKPQLTPTAEERYGKTTDYLDKSQKFDQQQKLAQTDVELPEPKQKNEQAVKDNKGENAKATLTILESMTVTSKAPETGYYAVDFKAYVNGLNKLDEAYIAWEAAKQKAADAYDEKKGGAANNLGYDNRKFYKEDFYNYFYKVNNAGTNSESWTPMTFVSSPGVAATGQTQDKGYTHEEFLLKLKDQLEDMWGTFDNVTYKRHIDQSLADYATPTDKLLLLTISTFINQLNDDPASPHKNYAKRAIANAKAAKELDEKLAEVKGAIKKLRERVASSPIYSAKPEIYAVDPTNLPGPQSYVVPVEGELSTSTKNISYTIPAKEGQPYTWKQILFDFEKDVKSWDASWEKVIDEKDEENFDNDINNNHSKRLVILLNKLKEQYDTADPTKLADQILSQIEEFVKEGGVIDQQEQAYATHAAKDNYASWKDFLDPSSGALNKLNDRIQKDWKGADGNGGYYVKDDPDQDDYYVGYDQPDATTGEPDGKIDTNTELVTFKSWKNIPGYNDESLNSDKYQVFTALINSFDKKRKEALAIYDKWVTNADTAIPTAWDADGNPTAYKAQADWEEPLDYEKANVELAKAAEMIDEVNTKLKAEFELPLVKEIKAQREHENIRKNIFNDETQTDGNNNSNMAYVKYRYFKLGKWDNGRKGVSKVVMGDCTNLLGFFKPLTDQLLNDGPADQEAYDEVKVALNPNDLKIYQRIEAVYKRALQLRKDMNDAYLQGNPQEQWENGKQLEYKQIETEIKSIVTACGEQEADIVANQEALKALQKLDNVDADNGNGKYDFEDLFEVDADGNPIGIKDLTLTSGYQNIKTNDDKAEKPEDLLEPYKEGEDGGIDILQTFYNQLADGDNQKPSVAVMFATARALREAAEDEKIGGELYEAVKQFLTDLNEAIKKRTLDDELVEFKKRFRELCDNVLLIDQHALENKLNYASMLEDVDLLQKQYDAAKAIVVNMPESDARTIALEELQSAYDANVGPLKDVAKMQYEAGHAWKDDVQEDWNKQFNEFQTALTKALDLLTGENNSTIVDENSKAYNTFDKDYKAATTEYYILVDKLEQLKNLDADVAQYSYQFKVKEATDLATEINDYLFSDATENPKDALDRIYAEGTADKNACNTAAPAKAWASKWGTDLNTIKLKIEEYIGKVDGQIDKAMDDWPMDNGDYTYSKQIRDAAMDALEDYSIYWETYKPINAMPKSQAKTDALANAVNDVITRNDVFNPLYAKTIGVDKLIDKIKGSKDGKKGYKELLDVNKLYDEIKYLADNFNNAEKSLLTEGKDIEAVKEVNSYKDYAKKHLEEDKQTLIELGLPLDEKIPGGENLDELSEKTFNEVYKDYVNIFFEEDAETGELVEKKVTAATWDTFVDYIQPVVGWKKIINNNTGKWKWTDQIGSEFSECQFIHQLKTNADKQNQEANMALVAKLKSAVDDARAYIAGYQVAPQFDIDLIDLAMAVEKAEQLIQDPERIASTNNITAQVNKLQNLLGLILNKATGKYDKENADKPGTMDAETSSEENGLPETVKAAFDAEKKHLEADVNALRAEYKKYTEAGNADNGYNERIEGLWTDVEAAKCEKVIDVTTVNGADKKDFKEWIRTDLVKDIQTKVKALWKELRAANNDAIDMAATAQALNDRLASLADNKVQDAYAAGAPDVTSYQQVIDELIAEAQAAVAASAQAGDVDYEREKLEAMAQNVENMIAARDVLAKDWTNFKEYADELLDDFLDALNLSKSAVNQWVDDEYDLAANANSAELYAQADAKGAEYAQLWSDIVAKYPETKAVVSKDLDDLGDEFLELIEQAEDAAADFDLGNRLTNLNNQLTVLKNKAKNGNYPEGYLYDKGIYDPETEDFLSGITDIEDDIVDFSQLLETTETTVGTTDPDAMYASLRAKLDDWILDDPDTEKDETELIGGIQKDINDVAEILGSKVLGDMNNDGKVTLVDAKMIADIVLGKSSQPMPGTDDFTHADVNEDGVITIADASCAVNIYFYGNPEGINYWVPEEARVAGKTAEKLELTTSKTADGLTRVAVNLDNVQAYTAFQMDMQLPEGVKLVVAHMGERANTQYLMVNELEDATRIAALSLTNKAFKGNSGAVLYLDFEVAEGAQENFVRFQNVLFVNRNAQQTAFELGGITPTGIQSANAETALGQKIYDLGGRMKSSLKKGVNIIKDAAGNARKVFSK